MVVCRCSFGMIAGLCLSLGFGMGADGSVRIRFTAYPVPVAVSPGRVSVTAGGVPARVLRAAKSRPLLLVLDPNSYGRQELRARIGRFAQVLASSGAGQWTVRVGIPVLDGILGPEVAEPRKIAAALDQAVLSYVPERPGEPLTAGRTLDSISELVARAETQAAGPVDCLLLFRDRLFEGEGGAYLNEGMAHRLAASAFGEGSTLYGWLDGEGVLKRACAGSGGMAWGTETAPAEVLTRLAEARRRALTVDVEFPRDAQNRRTGLDLRGTTPDGIEIRLRAPEAFWLQADGSGLPDHRRMQQALDWIRRAHEARGDGNFTLARRFAESAIKEDSWNPEGYYLAAASALELGDFPSARALAEQGIAGAGPEDRTLAVLAAASRGLGKAAEALARLQPLLPVDRSPAPELGLELARLHASTGQLAAAEGLFSGVLDAGHRDADVLVDFAGVLFRLGKRDEARAQLTLALDTDRNSARAMILLAQSFAADGDAGHARAWAAKALERNPVEAETLAGLAAVHAALREWLPAAENLQKALILAPGRQDLRKPYVEALCRAGRERDAVAFLRKSIESDPADQAARHSLGAILSDSGELEEAAIAWETAAAAGGPDSYELYRTAAALRERRGEYGQALLDYRAMARSAHPGISAQLRAGLRPHLSAIALLAGGERRPERDPLAKELGLAVAPATTPAGSVQDNAQQPVGPGATIEVPGGLALLARTIGLGVPATGEADVLERIFTLILDSGSAQKGRLRDDPVRRTAVSALRTYTALMRYLTVEGLLPPGFDPRHPQELVFPLYGPAETTNRARKLLRFFGVHLGIKEARDGGIQLTLTLKQGGAAAARQELLRNMGVTLTDRALRELRFTPKYDSIPILLDPQTWADKILPEAKKQYGLLERFLLNPPAMRLYLALAGCSRDARAGLVEAYKRGELLELVGPLSAYGRYLDFRDGSLVFPGERDSWEALLGAEGSGNRPALDALLRRDDGRALRIYASLALAPRSVRQYLTATPERLKELHQAFLSGGRGGKAASQIGQPDLGRVLRLMEADSRGLLLPIDRRLTPAVLPGAPAEVSAGGHGAFEPLAVRDKDLGRLLDWTGTASSQLSLSPLEPIELISWLQATHPEMLDEETAGAIVRSPAAAASMVDIIVDLSPGAPAAAAHGVRTRSRGTGTARSGPDAHEPVVDLPRLAAGPARCAEPSRRPETARVRSRTVERLGRGRVRPGGSPVPLARTATAARTGRPRDWGGRGPVHRIGRACRNARAVL